MNYQEISKVLILEPQLGLYGFSRGGKPEKRKQIYTHQRELDACVDWIQLMKGIKSINHHYHSYHYKHMVERGSGFYIPEGVFIVAAIHCGYRYKRVGNSAAFNLLKKPIRAWAKMSGYTV